MVYTHQSCFNGSIKLHSLLKIANLWTHLLKDFREHEFHEFHESIRYANLLIRGELHEYTIRMAFVLFVCD